MASCLPSRKDGRAGLTEYICRTMCHEKNMILKKWYQEVLHSWQAHAWWKTTEEMTVFNWSEREAANSHGNS